MTAELKRFQEFSERNPSLDPHQMPAVRAAMRRYLRANNACAFCGAKKHLDVHHIIPTHQRPDLAADEMNMMTLCGERGCHRVVGHFGNFKNINPNAPVMCAMHGANS